MNNLSKLDLAERLLITGHALASISMAIISIGAILRKTELPDSPLFNTNSGEGGIFSKDVNRNTNHSNDYWRK